MDARPAVLSARPGRVVYVSTSTRKSLVFQPPAACKTSAQLLAAIDAAHAAQYPDQAQTRFTALYVVHNNRHVCLIEATAAALHCRQKRPLTPASLPL
jgi:hypothetical protein